MIATEFKSYRPPVIDPVVVELTSPLQPEVMQREVHDISSSGFSLEIDPQIDLFPAGMVFSQIRIRIGKAEFHGRGQIRNLSRGGARDLGMRCGVQLEGRDGGVKAPLTGDLGMQLADPARRRAGDDDLPAAARMQERLGIAGLGDGPRHPDRIEHSAQRPLGREEVGRARLGLTPGGRPHRPGQHRADVVGLGFCSLFGVGGGYAS